MSFIRELSAGTGQEAIRRDGEGIINDYTILPPRREEQQREQHHPVLTAGGLVHSPEVLFRRT